MTTSEWDALTQEYRRRTGMDCYCGSLDGLRETLAKLREQEVEPEA